jgi:RHS repeat-associated protein
MTSACKSPTCASGFDKVEFAYDGEGHRTQLKTTSAAGAVATRDFRYQSDAIVEEKLTDASHAGVVVRSYVTDDSGATVKLVIPAGEPDPGTYLVTWSGHGDALALWRQNSDGTTTLANSFTYDTWGRPTTTVHNGIADLGFRFTYVGEFDVQWDDSFGLGLLYMHARHYSPALGRFLQPDPDGSEANLYAYTTPATTRSPSSIPTGRASSCAWSSSASSCSAAWARRPRSSPTAQRRPRTNGPGTMPVAPRCQDLSRAPP